jgi:hypothetical protein
MDLRWKIEFCILFLIVGLTSIVAYEIAIQPVLVWIDPMFADDIISIPGRGDPHPARQAMGFMFVILMLISIPLLSLSENQTE